MASIEEHEKTVKELIEDIEESFIYFSVIYNI